MAETVHSRSLSLSRRLHPLERRLPRAESINKTKGFEGWRATARIRAPRQRVFTCTHATTSRPASEATSPPFPHISTSARRRRRRRRTPSVSPQRSTPRDDSLMFNAHSGSRHARSGSRTHARTPPVSPERRHPHYQPEI